MTLPLPKKVGGQMADPITQIEQVDARFADQQRVNEELAKQFPFSTKDLVDGSVTNAKLESALQTTTWTALPYASGWGDFGGGNQVGQYRRAGDEVQVRGLVTKTSGLPAAFDDIATLPAGFRPPATVRFPVAAGGSTNTILGWVEVLSTGVLEIVILTAVVVEQDYIDVSSVRYSTT